VFDALNADPAWSQIDFLSDLHLSQDTPRTFEALAQHLRRTPAQVVFLLGDIFEVWVGDDMRFEGFEAQATAMLEEAGQRLALFFMAGNRDFLLGADMLAAARLRGLNDPTVLHAFGQRLLLSHGDALCLDDTAYQQFRAQVRGAPWQQAFLARPLAERKQLARQMRAQSQEVQRGQTPADWADLDRAATLAWLQQADAPRLIHGHTHRPALHQLDAGHQRWVLSDWDLDGQHGPARADVLRLSAAGLQRIAPDRG
jgi:UDP-2,3-diacylglucosamine hydrolase